MKAYTVESVDSIRSRRGLQWEAVIWYNGESYTIGPAYSVAELLQRVLDRFATTSAASAAPGKETTHAQR